MITHGCDEDCIAAGTVDPATGDCTACGVTGCRNDDGTVCPPCGSCDGERFHRAGCPESDAGANITETETLVAHAADGMALIRDASAPMLFAVYSTEGEILGAGNTSTEALADARKTIEGWRANRAQEGAPST